MNYSRTLVTVCCLLATAFLAVAQTPPPAPPSPATAPAVPEAPLPPGAPARAIPVPAPAPTPLAVPTPMPVPLAPLPPIDIDLGDLDPQVRIDLSPEMQQKLESLRDQADRMRLDFERQVAVQDLTWDVQDKVRTAQEQAALAAQDSMARSGMRDKLETLRDQAGRINLDLGRQFDMGDSDLQAKLQAARMKLDLAFAPQDGGGRLRPPAAPDPPMPPMTRKGDMFRGMGDEHLYSAGQSALDSRHWDQAVEAFSQVISRNSPRADGALYWKAYALGKLGRRDDAVAAIAELRKSHVTSRWMDDAKALELELRQSSGQSVSPEAESDEELKLMAINGLMQSNPERAVPLLENQLKGSATPRVKRNALFVLAQSNSPKAQALIEQIARGGANPDLQVKAIMYMDQRRKPNSNVQILADIYTSTSDPAVKRAILQAYAGSRDKDRLLQAARSEKSPELREFAIGALAGSTGTPELWQLYQAEPTVEGKVQLLRYMHANSNADKLLDVVRTEKDPKVRLEAVRALTSQRTGVAADTLVSLYTSEQDSQIKQRVLDGLLMQRNAKALVDIARAEKDTKLKLRIVERLSTMKAKEATDYLEELLKK